MRTYVKLYGPPILKALKALEKIALDIPQVCIMDQIISAYETDLSDMRSVLQDPDSGMGTQFFQDIFGPQGRQLSQERCSTIISESGEALGEFDFFFEWFRDPKMEELKQLIKKIDESLEPTGCRYSIITK